MAQDLKSAFERQRKEVKYVMKPGHEKRFLARLDQELPKSSSSTPFFWIKIAASVLVLISIGSYFLLQPDKVSQTDILLTQPAMVKNISLGDLSPDLQKIENFYVANINLELSKLTISSDNKDMIDGFMVQLSALDKEYKSLNQELNEIGPNDQTIEALIKNLQLRLQLLQKLRIKLNQLKSSKNEQESTNII
ncbi:MAG: hypothetical protein KJO73_07190 [Croceitalea sp.]|nr:hypothetical protein [Croceitalea sp.]NNC35000.1 hypothetical protein [Croceitalea sp.]